MNGAPTKPHTHRNRNSPLFGYASDSDPAKVDALDGTNPMTVHREPLSDSML
jgi:hypothetical protein